MLLKSLGRAQFKYVQEPGGWQPDVLYPSQTLVFLPENAVDAHCQSPNASFYIKIAGVGGVQNDRQGKVHIMSRTLVHVSIVMVFFGTMFVVLGLVVSSQATAEVSVYGATMLP